MANKHYVPRIAKMLETAAGEKDWQVKWARVNRATGILVGVATAVAVMNAGSETYASRYCEELANEVSEALTGVLDPPTLKTMVEGLAKRVASGLVEFYGEGRS